MNNKKITGSRAQRQVNQEKNLIELPAREAMSILMKFFIFDINLFLINLKLKLYSYVLNWIYLIKTLSKDLFNIFFNVILL